MLRFGRFELDYDNRRLMSAGQEVPLEQRAFDLLWYLATHPRKLIRKDELLEQVWNAQVLSDGVLSNTVAKLRKALGQEAREREPIETLYGRGYRFHADVEERAESAAAASVRSPQLSAAGADPFVGRSTVLALFEDRLARAKAGQGQLVLIAGDAGIGKSRTLAELVPRAKALGFSAWQGSAYADGAVPAYWPWVEVLRAAATELGESWQKHVPSDAQVLARWVPELISCAPREVDAQELRFRAFDELARFLAAACRRGPRLVVLEDLQFTDAATINLLAHVARATRIQLALMQCETVAGGSHVFPLHQAIEILRAGRSLAEGRLDDLEAGVDKLREGSSLPGGLGLVWMWYALQLSAARGQSIDALMAQGDLSVLQHVAPRQRNSALVGAARVIARAGHPAVAEELMKIVALRREDLERLPNLYGDLGFLCSLVELRWALRERSDVALLEQLLLPHASLNAVGIAFDYNGSVAHYLGMLSLMQGRHEEAIERLQMAYAHNERLNMPLQLAWTRSLLNDAMS